MKKSDNFFLHFHQRWFKILVHEHHAPPIDVAMKSESVFAHKIGIEGERRMKRERESECERERKRENVKEREKVRK